MKRDDLIVFVFSAILIGFLNSCLSLDARHMTPVERTEMQVIGTVSTKWTSLQFFHILPSEKALENKAYSELRAEAQRQGYSGNIDIKNITVAGTFNPLTLMPIFPHAGVLGNFQTVIASGDVVEYVAQNGGNSSLMQRKITEAVVKSSEALIQKMPEGSTIAVLSVYSADRNTSEYIIGELEYNLVNAGQFRIVDRRRLDQIRNEQNFQMSGEVSDDSAVSIGNMLGANIVLTGEISGTGSSQRLIIKALDVKTAQIIAMTREEM